MLNSTSVDVPIIRNGVANCMYDVPWKYFTTEVMKTINE